ncbi:MAG: hypothetical protein AAGA86_02905 [Bacteroidota bacterium]
MSSNFLNLNFMKTTRFFINAFVCIALATTFTSCSDDDDNPEEVNENEFITNVNLVFTNDADASDIVTLANAAPNGQDGPFTNTVVGSFTAGETYSLSIGILNGDEDVIVSDIIPEADEHFFWFRVNGINLTMTRDSDDVAGVADSKLGFNTTWVAGDASTGNVQIALIHQPTGADDSDEWGTATGGSEDLNITFEDVEIE